MSIAIITGSSGLIGSESVAFFVDKFDKVIGIDNDMRQYYFGENASTDWNRKRLEEHFDNFTHIHLDIRNQHEIERIFKEYSDDIKLVIHAAAQPSHDWATKEPHTDFTVNANGTLNMLEATRKYASDAVFIFTSTNKVYGDTPNTLPFVELESRWEIDESHPYFLDGIDELMSIDQCKHSLFGASKVSADILVQEYGKYFGLKTGVFRGGCLTGPNHSGTQLHGFLSYLMKCAVTGDHYSIFGYKGKQVRDNIHSHDLVNMFWHFYQQPRMGEVYNAGGGRFSNCSIIEGISYCERITENKMNYSFVEENRIGDHIWYITDSLKFKNHYPDWSPIFDLNITLIQIFNACKSRY
jgi:CDP-paratose 2-epimerase